MAKPVKRPTGWPLDDEVGIRPLDRVLVQLPNWNEFVFAYFALQKIGAIPVLLIDRYRQFEITRLISSQERHPGSWRRDTRMWITFPLSATF